MVTKEKKEKNCSIHGFGIQISECLSVVLVDKNSIYTHNQLYAIISFNIWYCQIQHIGPLSLYKRGKKCLKVKLQGKTILQYLYCTFL